MDSTTKAPSSKRSNGRRTRTRKAVAPSWTEVRGVVELTHFESKPRSRSAQLQKALDRANLVVREALRLGGPEMALTDPRAYAALRELGTYFPAAAAMMRDVLVERAAALRKARLSALAVPAIQTLTHSAA